MDGLVDNDLRGEDAAEGTLVEYVLVEYVLVEDTWVDEEPDEHCLLEGAPAEGASPEVAAESGLDEWYPASGHLAEDDAAQDDPVEGVDACSGLHTDNLAEVS